MNGLEGVYSAEISDIYRSFGADLTHIVPNQIGYHDVFGAFFRVVSKVFNEMIVF